jgi:hypothetical protein
MTQNTFTFYIDQNKTLQAIAMKGTVVQETCFGEITSLHELLMT